MKLMKYIIGYLVLVMLIGPAFASAQTGTVAAKSSESANVKLFAVPPQRGQKSEVVKDLQRILGTNPAVYPKGLVTGYFGPATEAAVKRLQIQYGLAPTGIVDEVTQNVIFPSQIKLAVLAPNGGEVWDRSTGSTAQIIQWESYVGPANGWRQMQALESTVSAPSSGGSPTSIFEEKPNRYPVFGRASLDLIRDSNPLYVYHIGTVDLYQSSYTWKVPQEVPAGNDFRVRISVGGHVPCIWAQDTGMPMEQRVCPKYYPIYSASDTSDGTFTISGNVVPDPDIIARLKAQVNEMETTLTMLMRHLQAMKEELARI